MGPPDQQGPQYIDTKRKTMKNLKKIWSKAKKNQEHFKKQQKTTKKWETKNNWNLWKIMKTMKHNKNVHKGLHAQTCVWRLKCSFQRVCIESVFLQNEPDLRVF